LKKKRNRFLLISSLLDLDLDPLSLTSTSDLKNKKNLPQLIASGERDR